MFIDDIEIFHIPLPVSSFSDLSMFLSFKKLFQVSFFTESLYVYVHYKNQPK